MVQSVYTAEYRTFLGLLIAQRKKAGVTQQELADRLGRPQSFISKYEHGQRRLDVVEFLAVARALGADPHAIFSELEHALGAMSEKPR